MRTTRWHRSWSRPRSRSCKAEVRQPGKRYFSVRELGQSRLPWTGTMRDSKREDSEIQISNTGRGDATVHPQWLRARGQGKATVQPQSDQGNATAQPTPSGRGKASVQGNAQSIASKGPQRGEAKLHACLNQDAQCGQLHLPGSQKEPKSFHQFGGSMKLAETLHRLEEGKQGLPLFQRLWRALPWWEENAPKKIVKLITQGVTADLYCPSFITTHPRTNPWQKLPKQGRF